MKKLILILLITLMIGINVYAEPARIPNPSPLPDYEPVQMADNQTIINNSVIETKNKISVTLSFVKKQPEISVKDPDSAGKVVSYFSPYSYTNVIDTLLFSVLIKNENFDKSIEISAKECDLFTENDPQPVHSLYFMDIAKLWREYYYLNTYTITGSPIPFEQERGIISENYILKTAFKGGTLASSKNLEGFLAFPKPSGQPQKLVVYIRDIYLDNQAINFKFMFHSSGIK